MVCLRTDHVFLPHFEYHVTSTMLFSLIKCRIIILTNNPLLYPLFSNDNTNNNRILYTICVSKTLLYTNNSSINNKTNMVSNTYPHDRIHFTTTNITQNKTRVSRNTWTGRPSWMSLKPWFRYSNTVYGTSKRHASMNFELCYTHFASICMIIHMSHTYPFGGE